MQNAPLRHFGIHQATFKDLADPSVLGMAKILGSAEIDLKQEMIKLEGGSSIVPWDVAPGRASGEITLNIRQYDKEILRFLSPWTAASESEEASGEASGSVTSIVNAKGTSVADDTNGIESISIDSASDLAAGNYTIVATGAATVDIYIDNDLSSNVEYQDSTLKINSSAITIASGADTAFKGLNITGGSGAIGFTTGDVATFTVNPISNYKLNHYFGKKGACLREFELTIFGECVNGRIRKTRFPRCVASANTAMQFLEKEWAAMEATVQVLAPETVDYVSASVFINR